MSQLLIVIVPFMLAVPLWVKFDLYKKRYRKRHPGCWWIPPTGSAMLANLLTTFSLMAFMWIYMDFKPYL